MVPNNRPRGEEKGEVVGEKDGDRECVCDTGGGDEWKRGRKMVGERVMVCGGALSPS